MISSKRIAVVMPAYNAEKTLEATVADLPDLVDVCILVDDHSSDSTVALANRLGLRVFQHDRNYGYGRNQQTCYREALAAGADVVIMLHPDYQYTPLLVTAMASMVAYDVYDVVLGSRIIGGAALRGGMPVYKYISNRLLTAFENLFLRVKLSEYHTILRRSVVHKLPPQCGIRARRARHYLAVLAAENRCLTPCALQRPGTQARTWPSRLLCPPLRDYPFGVDAPINRLRQKV
jgi:glycosyltransferase involved in cell wall biosynthesis